MIAETLLPNTPGALAATFSLLCDVFATAHQALRLARRRCCSHLLHRGRFRNLHSSGECIMVMCVQYYRMVVLLLVLHCTVFGLPPFIPLSHGHVYPRHTSGGLVTGDRSVNHVLSKTADTPGTFEVSCGDASTSCTATMYVDSSTSPTTDQPASTTSIQQLLYLG